MGMVPLISRITHDREVSAALAFAQQGRHLVVGNLGLLGEAVRRGATVEAHWSLNALNAASVEELARMGADRVWLSPELTGRQLAEVAGACAAETGTAVYGRQEVMVTEHCVLMAEGECDRRCGSCARRTGERSLKDRKGYLFPVRTDITGRSHVFNSVHLDLGDSLAEVLATGVSAVRVDVHTLPPGNAARAVARMRDALTLVLAGRPATVVRDGQATSGHFFRGIS